MGGRRRGSNTVSGRELLCVARETVKSGEHHGDSNEGIVAVEGEPGRAKGWRGVARRGMARTKARCVLNRNGGASSKTRRLETSNEQSRAGQYFQTRWPCLPQVRHLFLRMSPKVVYASIRTKRQLLFHSHVPKLSSIHINLWKVRHVRGSAAVSVNEPERQGRAERGRAEQGRAGQGRPSGLR